MKNHGAPPTLGSANILKQCVVYLMKPCKICAMNIYQLADFHKDLVVQALLKLSVEKGEWGGLRGCNSGNAHSMSLKFKWLNFMWFWGGQVETFLNMERSFMTLCNTIFLFSNYCPHNHPSWVLRVDLIYQKMAPKPLKQTNLLSCKGCRSGFLSFPKE